MFERQKGLSKPSKIGRVPCHRCGGNGYVPPWGVCFRCGGQTVDPTARGWVYPETWTDSEIRTHEAEREQRNAQARERSAAAKQRKQDKQWAENVAQFPELTALPAYLSEAHNAFADDIYDKAHKFPLSEKQVAAVVRVIAAHQARLAEAEIRAESSHHIGEVGEKITVTGEVTTSKVVEGFYGSTVLTVLTTESGAEVKFFSTAKFVWSLEVGEKITVQATVKSHDEYEGVQQTLVTRPRVQEVVTA